MAHVSLRVSEDEKKWMESYANFHGISLSEALKNIFFERLEDEYDLKMIEEYEKDKANGNNQIYSLDEVKKELGL